MIVRSIRYISLTIFLSLQMLVYGGELQKSSLSDRENQLIAHVQTSIANAEQGLSKLTSDVLAIEGYSSSKGRHLLNNLCSLPNTNYLEIGCWKGSTWVASLFGNSATMASAVAIDNWSELSGPKEAFAQNCETFLQNYVYRFLSTDCFSLNLSSVFSEPVTIYFYDGAHSERDQELAFTYYNEVLDDVFITVIDDWNFSSVPLGTRKAFQKLQYEILFETVLPARWNADRENWWNGLYVAVIRKSTSTP